VDLSQLQRFHGRLTAAANGQLRFLFLTYLRTYESLRKMLHVRARKRREATASAAAPVFANDNTPAAAAAAVTAARGGLFDAGSTIEDIAAGDCATAGPGGRQGGALDSRGGAGGVPLPGERRCERFVTEGVLATEARCPLDEQEPAGATLLDQRAHAILAACKAVWLRQRRGVDWDDDDDNNDDEGNAGGVSGGWASAARAAASHAASHTASHLHALRRDDPGNLTYVAGDAEGYAQVSGVCVGRRASFQYGSLVGAGGLRSSEATTR